MSTWLARSVFVCLLLLTPAAAPAQPAPCTATDGPGIAKCVERAYPERLKPTATLKERTDNATFLRDRVIETARCLKLDVGHNCKRGNCNTISVDFIAWRNGGVTEGVDIIGGWDDLTRTLSIGWHRYKAPDYGHPTYQAYGPVSCVIDSGNGNGEPQTPPSPPAPENALTLRVGTLERLVDALNGSINALMARIDTLTMNNAESEALDNRLQQENDALRQRANDLQHALDVLRNRYNNTTCRAIFGCTVVKPE